MSKQTQIDFIKKQQPYYKSSELEKFAEHVWQAFSGASFLAIVDNIRYNFPRFNSSALIWEN